METLSEMERYRKRFKAEGITVSGKAASASPTLTDAEARDAIVSAKLFTSNKALDKLNIEHKSIDAKSVKTPEALDALKVRKLGKHYVVFERKNRMSGKVEKDRSRYAYELVEVIDGDEKEVRAMKFDTTVLPDTLEVRGWRPLGHQEMGTIKEWCD